MSKADSKSICSRRSMLAAAAPIAAVAFTAAPAIADQGDDAELITLGEEWDRAVAEGKANGRAVTVAHRAGDHETVHLLEGIGDDLHASRWKIGDAIFATPAAGLAGLAIKARVLRYEFRLNCMDRDGDVDVDVLDADEKDALLFAEDVLRLAARARS